MDFRLTEEEISLREQIASFARREVPEDWEAGFEYEEYCPEHWPVTRQMARKLAAQGWLGMGWSEAYGGTNRSVMSQLIFYEEAVYHRIPAYDMGIGGVSNVGALLALYGTEEQKKERLVRLAKGTEFWCIGYSEPDAGSDLRSLSSQAIASDNGFVINGSKIWTSAAQAADWCWLLARVGADTAKNRGLTIFLVNMKSSGITVSPIKDICGFPSFNQVYFDNVFVEKANVLGEVGKGWDYMPVLLFLERTFQAGASIARARRLLDDTVNYLRNYSLPACRNRELIRHRLAGLKVEIEVGRLAAYRAAWFKQRGLMPESVASTARVYSSRIEQGTARTIMGVLGLFGQLKGESPHSRLRGAAEHLYLCSLSDSILGGTTQIQKNIIALRGLGLPR